jgi:hypothetical protein
VLRHEGVGGRELRGPGLWEGANGGMTGDGTRALETAVDAGR